MADQEINLSIPPRGALDTSYPISDRPLGTLIEAKDVHPQYWGPREGSLKFTGVWEGPGTGALYDEITFTVGNSVNYGVARSYEAGVRDLGTSFTLDLWFRMTDTSFATGSDAIGLYSFTTGGGGLIEVYIRGPNSGTAVPVARIITSPTRGTASSATTITGSTVVSVGTDQNDKHHLRLVRDGANATLYLNGTSVGTTAAVSATDPINGELDDEARVTLAYGEGVTDIGLKGILFGAVLRDGAFSSLPIENRMPCDPWAQNVRHFHLGRTYNLGAAANLTHIFDAGRYGLHARIIGTGTSTDFSASGANDDRAPAPAPVQGFSTWTTRTNKTATTVVVGGIASTAVQS